jgi:hypothetical protein
MDLYSSSVGAARLRHVGPMGTYYSTSNEETLAHLDIAVLVLSSQNDSRGMMSIKNTDEHSFLVLYRESNPATIRWLRRSDQGQIAVRNPNSVPSYRDCCAVIGRIVR